MWADPTGVSIGNVAGASAATGAADNTWTQTTGNTNWTHRWGMSNPPTGELANGTQTITVRAKKEAGQTGTPTASVVLYENGTSISTIVATTNITSGTGQDLVGTFDPTGRNLDNIEIEVVVISAGGSPGVRTSVQVDSITWTGDFIVPQAFTATPNDTEGLTDAFAPVLDAARLPSDTESLTETVALASAFARAQTDNLGLTDVPDRLTVFTRAASDNQSLTDTFDLVRERPVSDSINVTDTVDRARGRELVDAAGTADAVNALNARASGSWIRTFRGRVG